VPWRHQSDEAAAGRQVREIGELDGSLADYAGDAPRLLVRQFEELVQQAELVDELERRGMDGVAAEIAQEVAMLLQPDDLDPPARQQESEHHAGRPAADDAAAGGQFARAVLVSHALSVRAAD